MKDRARSLRRSRTEAEQKLWSQLRNQRLGVKFRRQQSIGPFIVDFCCPEKWLVVEIDGGQHNDDAARRADASRSRYIEQQGNKIIRFWNDEVLKETDAVLLRIPDLL